MGRRQSEHARRMRAVALQARILTALVVVGAGLACDAPIDPNKPGSLRITIAPLSPQPEVEASAPIVLAPSEAMVTLDSVRGTARAGATTRSATSSTKNAAGDKFVLRIDNLPPAAYTITIEGFSSNAVVYTGTVSATVSAGAAATAEVTNFAPFQPTSLTATRTAPTTISLSWANVSNEAGFAIERCQGAGCSSFTPLATTGADVTTYQNTGLPINTSYSYRVRAEAPNVTSGWSPTATALTLGPPTAPTTLSAATATSTQINLSWTDNAANEDGFRIERCEGASCSTFTEIATVAANATTFQNTGVTANVAFSYQVRAYNAAGTSTFSNIASATTISATAPSGLTAVAVSATQVNLGWTDAGDDETGFRIERCSGVDCTSFVEIATVGPNIVSYQNTGLTAGTPYGYRVRSYNNAGNSAYTSTATALTAAPTAPTTLVATTTGAAQIDLSWTDASTNEDGFRVERCDGPSCSSFAEVAIVPANATGYTNTGLATSTSYSYRVRAYNQVGTSGFTNIATSTTILPSAPSGLTATTVSGSQIDLSWSDGSSNEDGFRIESCSGASCSSFAEIGTVLAGVTTYQSTGLSVNTVYSFRVRAHNGAGTSAFTNTATANTNLPAAPSGLTAVAQSDSEIYLAWADNAGNETGFYVDRCDGVSCSSFAQIADLGPNSTDYSNTGLTVGTSYTYRVRAYNIAGGSSYAGPATAATSPPAVPSGLTATTFSATQINLSWTDNSGDEVGFRIQQCEGLGCSGFTDLTLLGPNVTSYPHQGLTPGESYTYRVEAYNAVGPSGYSATATVTTAAPDAPTVLTATTISNSQIDLGWTDNSNNEDGFYIERCEGVGCSSFAQVAQVGAGVETYQNTGLTAEQSYTYQVRAFNAAGPSAYTNTATATTMVPADPTGLVATTISASQIDLSWNDVAGNEAGYRVERCDGVACSNFSQIADLAAGSISYSSTGLTVATSYSYRVYAYNTAGSSGFSNTATSTTDVPGVPSALVATTVAATQIDLAWSDNSGNELGFYVERCAGASCSDFTQLADVGADVEDYQDGSVGAGTSYTYRVRAHNASGTSGYSNEATATTIPPDAPSGLAATTVSATQIDLSWADNSATEAGFSIEQCAGDACNSFAEIATVGLGVTIYQNAPVATGESFTYRVRAQNAAGYSAYSNEITATTRVPTDPSSLSATAMSGTQIDLSWSDNSDNEQGFYIERCTGAGCSSWGQIGQVGINVSIHQDAGVSSGTSYSYRVRAFNVVGVSGFSGEVTATTILPAAPSTLSATTISESEIALAWTDNADNEYGFYVEVCDGPGCSDFENLALLGPDANSFNAENLAGSTSYSFRVRAYNGAGSSTYSNTATSETSPPAPSNLVATTQSSSEIQLTWTDEASNEEGFIVEACVGFGCSNFAPIQTLAPNVESYNDGSVTPGEFFSYRVQTYNSSGGSRYSNQATANTNLPGDPADLLATTVSGSQIALTWSAVDNENGFEIERCEGVACSNFGLEATIGPDNTGYNDAGLTIDVIYTYRVRATNAVGNSNYSNEATANTVLPAPPAALGATTVSAGQIDLVWTDNASNEFGFRVERCVGAACSDFAELAIVGADVPDFQDGTVAVGTAYRYRVLAFNAAGASSPTNEAVATTILPAAPTILTATTISSTRIDLAWTDNADNEALFRIERCTGAACSNFAEIATANPNEVAYQNTGLNTTTFYSYRVRASNAAGFSTYSNTVSANTFPPAQPASLTATTVSGSQIDLAWTDNANNESGFRIERCTGAACTDFVEVGTAAANATSYPSGGLSINTTYRHRVRSYNGVGNSAYTNIATANTDLPADPTVLTAATVAPDQINLSWTDNAGNETGFRIERCVGNGCSDFSEISVVGVDVTTYQNTGLALNEYYSYRVRAYNISGTSLFTNEAADNTLLPLAPTTLLAVTITAGQVDLNWTDLSNNELGFRVERCAGAGCSSFAEIGTSGADVAVYSDATAAAGTAYRYRVRAYNIAGTSAYTNETTASTNLPAEPTGLVATTNTGSQIDLAWTDNADNEVEYLIERCDGISCSSFAQIATVGPDVSTYPNVGLTINTSYTYRVRATNALGESGYTNESTANTNLPVDPTSLTATTASGSRIDLAWTDNATNELSYRVERCTGVACADFAQIVTLPIDATTYFDEGLTLNTSYSYRVRAISQSGPSGYTNEATANTLLPAAPTNLIAAAISGTQVDLEWSENANNEQGYRIEECAGGGCSDFAEIATVGADISMYQRTGLTPSTVYSYRVRGYNIAGVSAFSNETGATTALPANPTVLVATTISASQIDLAWTDNSDNETSFRVEECTGAGCENDDLNFAEIGNVGAGVTAFQHTGLIQHTSHAYRVRAGNAIGFSGYTNEALATTNFPAIPTGLAATTVSASQIDLTWTDNANNETGFRIERCTGAGCSDFVQIDEVATDDLQAYSDGSTAVGLEYSYRIRAYNAAGPSGASNTANANTLLPAAPSALYSAVVNGGEITVYWTDNSNNEDGFSIEQCEGVGCSSFAEIAIVAAGVTSYPNSGLNFGTTYGYRVRAYNASGASTYSNVTASTTNTPSDPSALIATTASASQVNLSWTDNSDNEAQFRIERCDGVGCGSFAEIATVGPNVTAYQNTSLTIGTSYTYRVRASNAMGNSAGYTNEATANTFLPADPSDLTAQAGGSTSQINLAWTDNANNETGFSIEMCQGGACSNFAEIATVAANDDDYEASGLAPGQVYSFRVRAMNVAGYSGYTATATANTILPNAPTGLTATTVVGPAISLAWSDNSDNEFGFSIERCEGPGCSSFAEVGVAPGDQSFYQDNSVTTNSIYTYRVHAFNGAGNSASTNEATDNTYLPDTPVDFEAVTVSDVEIDLSWSDEAGNELGYIVERCVGLGCSSFAEIVTLGANATSYQNTGLSLGESYTYRVRAYNVAGYSNYTPEVTANTFVPADPENLAASTVSGTRVDLDWTDASNNEAGFRIERCEGGGCSDFVEIATVGAGVQVYQNTGLSVNFEYNYRVRAFNAAGNSGYSGTATANTFVPGDPSGLSANPSGTSITLNWTDNSSNETGFKIERCAGGGCPGSFAEIGQVGAGVNTFPNPGLAPNTLYGYRVRAFNIAGNSGYSGSAAAPTVPAAPSALGFSSMQYFQIDLSWADNSNVEAYMTIERCLGVGCTPTFYTNVGQNSTASNVPHDYSPDPANPNTYTYRLSATNAAGTSGYSNNFTIATPAYLGSGQTLLAQSGAFGNQRDFFFHGNSQELRIEITPSPGGATGEPDLFVAYPSRPTQGSFPFNNWSCLAGTGYPTCVPYGGQTERVTIPTPTTGFYYFMVHAYNAYTNMTIRALNSINQNYGYPAAFAGLGWGWNSGYLLAQQISVTDTLTVTHLGVITTAAAGNLTMGLYTDVGGNPSALITEGNASIAGGPGLQEIPVTKVTILPGVYWIGTLTDIPTTFRDDTVVLASTWKYVAMAYTTSLPGAFGGAVNYSAPRMNYYVKGYRY